MNRHTEDSLKKHAASTHPPGAISQLFGTSCLIERESSHHNLPLSLTDLVGREDELEAVHRMLQEGRLITLTGPGGVGKSHLALQVAWESLPHFHDGVYLVPLAAVSSPEFLVSTLAETLGFSFYSPSDLKQQLIDYLRAKEMLLIVDNFEHLLPGAGLLVEILQQAAGVKILVTSRERLNLHGEWVFQVQGLCFPEDGGEREIENYSAVQMFWRIAQRSCSSFLPSESDKQHVGRICRLVEGLPLAIELAATWIKALSCQEIAEELEKGFDFLTAAWQDVPERHHSLRAVFEHSWRLLTAEEKRIFRRLSVFQGGFQRDAAERVTGASLPVLSSLVDKSFLRWHPSMERYDLHQILKQHASEKLAQVPEEKEETHNRHCEHFAAFLHRQGAALHGVELGQALRQVGVEIENVRQAWRWAVQRARVNQIDRALESLYRFYEIRGRFREGAALFGEAAAGLHEAVEPAQEKVVW